MRFEYRQAMAGLVLACGCALAVPAAAQDPDVPQALEPRVGAPAVRDPIHAAEAAFRRRDFPAAIRAASAAIVNSQMPEQRRALALRLRGAAFLRIGRPDRAYTDFGAALAIEPGEAIGLAGRGAALVALGRPDAAMGDFNRALVQRRIPVLYYWRGVARFQLRDLRGAMVDFDNALALDPRYARAFYGRGLAYHALGQGIHARDEYEQALAIDPTLSAAREALAALRAGRPVPRAPARRGAPARNGVVQF